MVNRPKAEIGDVHAPVEDTKVPFALKVLITLVVLSVIGLAVSITILAIEQGLIVFPTFMF